MTEVFKPDTEKMQQEQELFKKFDGIYTTLAKLHPAYGRMRFRGAPFMPQPPEDLERNGLEDIAGHMWLTTITSRIILPVIPNAAKDIDQMTLTDMLLIHDIGEITHGDVSAFLQLNGHGKDRKEREDLAFGEIILELPEEVREELHTTHERYEREKNNPETRDKEALLAKIIDTVQGNHYVLTHSPNFSKYTDAHLAIVQKKLLPFTRRLEDVLKKEGNKRGAEEINSFTRHHLSLYKSKGVTIPYHSNI